MSGPSPPCPRIVETVLVPPYSRLLLSAWLAIAYSVSDKHKISSGLGEQHNCRHHPRHLALAAQASIAALATWIIDRGRATLTCREHK